MSESAASVETCGGLGATPRRLRAYMRLVKSPVQRGGRSRVGTFADRGSARPDICGSDCTERKRHADLQVGPSIADDRSFSGVQRSRSHPLVRIREFGLKPDANRKAITAPGWTVLGLVAGAAIIGLVVIRVTGVMDGSPSPTVFPPPQKRAPMPEPPSLPDPKRGQVCVVMPNGERICDHLNRLNEAE